ncbi:ABC transporter substrate-binding protein [Rhodococcus globerulus]|uniref:ABC transporter substrate-binding protein n=2 Tax=Rhodococcus TaxID=1827 RepID=UPI00286A8A5C|nr:ABC transporter substrate-binding protein [Rhodococcus globerulus]MDV8068367.1 ABC transporter substrate-binding protein [Rhodococcus sp. IEGM 1366]
MMIRRTRFLTAALAAACSTALVLTACSSSGADSQGELSTVGEPVPGGDARVIQVNEPRTLDPAGLTNNWANHAFMGNALYGTLMTNDVESFDIEYKLAEDFTTTDGGSTFTLKLRPGLQFSDGTPLDAAAVKFNWDRLADPALGSSSLAMAAQVNATEVADSTTLTVRMDAPNPHFAQTLMTNAMNWIASPTALQRGQTAFDAAPIGAGPFILTAWSRQDRMEFAKNPTYWDSPKPYLDNIVLRTANDSSQRTNTVMTGGADLTSEISWRNLAMARAAGFPVTTAPTGGGQYMAMNFRRAPFNDERARRAVALATDLDALDLAVNDGKGQVPETLFPETSPFHADIPLKKTDKEQAQKLFDELAAEGKPVSFTYTSFSTVENKAGAEGLQAQLSAFDNVDVKVDVVDFAAGLAIYGSHDYDMIATGAMIQDPDAELWSNFHGSSQRNLTGINDPELNDALYAGRIAESVDERKEAYEIVQKRIVALTPGLWYVRAATSVVTGKNVHGIELYGIGSQLPEELWITK